MERPEVTQETECVSIIEGLLPNFSGNGQTETDNLKDGSIQIIHHRIAPDGSTVFMTGGDRLLTKEEIDSVLPPAPDPPSYARSLIDAARKRFSLVVL